MEVLSARHDGVSHIVQFYENNEYLCEVAADFVITGLSAGDPVLVIATEPHRRRIAESLRSRGIDTDASEDGNRVEFVDARATLDRIMVNGRLDQERVENVFGGLVDRVRAGNAGIHVYGEMSDVLWRDGFAECALEMETMANTRRNPFVVRLLCSHAMSHFATAADQERFDSVCRLHDCVSPTERFVRGSESTRMLRITQLQQREKALESELSYRKRLETRLLTALGERDDLIIRERSARTDAEAANRAKGDFLAVMSHELRTPLNAIAGYAELLEMGIAGPLVEQQREMIGRIQRSQKHLLELIDEVLMFTRDDTTPAHARQLIRMVEVLRDAELGVLPALYAAELTYDAVQCDDSIVAVGDAGRIRRIVISLLTNATKYTPRGGKVRMECNVEEASVYVRVIDTGIGIPAGHLAGIFEPFYQVDTRLSRHDEGLGLGLAISRRFARAMDGDLTVASREGEGSTFTLRLPLHHAEDGEGGRRTAEGG